MKILNFGSLNLDYVYSVDHMVCPGETLASGGMEIFCGGKGLNQSVALARAGAEVWHAGLIGGEGGVLLDALKEAGVRCEFVKTVSGRSGHTIIQVDRTGQNCILLYGGANRAVTEAFADQVLENFGEGDMLLLQNEISCLPYIIDRAAEKGMEIALNPSPFDSSLSDCAMDRVSLFLVNEVEGWQMTGEKEPEEILAAMKEKYPRARVVLTLGGDGCICQYQDTLFRQPALHVKAVDTTAAGDTFTGYFLAALAEEMPVQDALKLASQAAAIAVTRPGAAPSIPLRSEVG
ncbi:MAG: ribokinase [Emergencia sp.]